MFKYENIGNKKRQEDFYFFFNNKNIDYYFVLDGHGYEKDKKFLIDILKEKDFFKNNILNFFDKYELNKHYIKLFFNDLDIYFKKKKINSGTCLTGLIVDYRKNIFFLLNIGDTKFYIFKDTKLIIESKEHNLNNIKELERIKKCNKNKFVKNGRYKTIAMTRVLGDFDCKNEKPNPIISIPEVYTFHISNLNIILSTDGIKFNYNINKIIKLFQEKKNLLEYCNNVNKENLKNYKNKTIDNILFLIIPIKPKTAEENFKEDLKYKLKEVLNPVNKNFNNKEEFKKPLIPNNKNFNNKEECKKPLIPNIKEEFKKPLITNNKNNLLNNDYIYNCLKNLFY